MTTARLSDRHIMIAQTHAHPQMFPPKYNSEIAAALVRAADVPGVSALRERIADLFTSISEIEKGPNHPGQQYVQLDGLLFELKCINYLLNDSLISELKYEPPGIDSFGKTIDLTFKRDGVFNAMECKVTNPQAVERQIPYDRFSNDLLIANPLYYNFISSARSHILEFLADTEAKLSNYSGLQNTTICLYKNFYIEDLELEHIWHYYKVGKPHPADTFSEMMEYEISRKGFVFHNSIRRLLALPFEQFGFGFKSNEIAIELT